MWLCRCIHTVKGTITITGAVKQLHERNKGVIFKNCAPLTKCA